MNEWEDGEAFINYGALSLSHVGHISQNRENKIYV